MSWTDKLRDVIKTAQTVTPILSAFGVPKAKTIAEAVDAIQGDEDRSNDDAVNLMAATLDAHERRILSLEKAAKASKK